MNRFLLFSPLVRQGLSFTAGLLLTGLLGLAVDKLVKVARQKWKAQPPAGVSETQWQKAFKLSDEELAPTRWLGWLERFGFFIAIWMGAPILVAGWLAFKVASKWANWQHIVRVPDKLEGVDPLEFFGATLRYASHILQRFLIGTLGNVLAALIGVGFGKKLILTILS